MSLVLLLRLTSVPGEGKGQLRKFGGKLSSSASEGDYSVHELSSYVRDTHSGNLR